jgi:hypothetical protein
MESTPQQALEQLIHRELSKLPDRSAPEDLIPAVLAQIAARQRKRWWQCPWINWPLAAQVASVPLLSAGVAACLLGLSMLWRLAMAQATVDTISERWDGVSAVWDVFAALGNAVLLLGRSVGQEWLLIALLIPLLMYVACVGLGTLCYRLASSCRRSCGVSEIA